MVEVPTMRMQPWSASPWWMQPRCSLVEPGRAWSSLVESGRGPISNREDITAPGPCAETETSALSRRLRVSLCE